MNSGPATAVATNVRDVRPVVLPKGQFVDVCVFTLRAGQIHVRAFSFDPGTAILTDRGEADLPISTAVSGLVAAASLSLRDSSVVLALRGDSGSKFVRVAIEQQGASATFHLNEVPLDGNLVALAQIPSSGRLIAATLDGENTMSLRLFSTSLERVGGEPETFARFESPIPLPNARVSMDECAVGWLEPASNGRPTRIWYRAIDALGRFIPGNAHVVNVLDGEILSPIVRCLPGGKMIGSYFQVVDGKLGTGKVYYRVIDLER